MNNAYKVIRDFEKTIARWAGAKEGVAVESCTSAIFLCCKYMNVDVVEVPRFTYRGVAMSVVNAGGEIKWSDEKWKGIYRLNPYPIIDSALRFKKNMYIHGTYYCLSFQYKKLLPIGRGGMILLNDKWDAENLRQMAFDGRKVDGSLNADEIVQGYHMYMTASQAADGLERFNFIKDRKLEDIEQEYDDISKYKAFR